MKYMSQANVHWTRPPQKRVTGDRVFWIGRCTCGASTMANVDRALVVSLINKHTLVAREYHRRMNP